MSYSGTVVDAEIGSLLQQKAELEGVVNLETRPNGHNYLGLYARQMAARSTAASPCCIRRVGSNVRSKVASMSEHEGMMLAEMKALKNRDAEEV